MSDLIQCKHTTHIGQHILLIHVICVVQCVINIILNKTWLSNMKTTSDTIWHSSLKKIGYIMIVQI